MNRTDLQDLAERRLREATLLAGAGEFAGAYYLAGYAVECGLKAVIASKTQQYDFPDKKLVLDSYVHELPRLAKTAGLQGAIDAEGRAFPDFEVNWAVATQWSESSRYEVKGEQDATGLLEAVSDPQHGVLQWLRRHW